MTGDIYDPKMLFATTTTSVGSMLTESDLQDMYTRLRTCTYRRPRVCGCGDCLKVELNELSRCACDRCYAEYKHKREVYCRYGPTRYHQGVNFGYVESVSRSMTVVFDKPKKEKDMNLVEKVKSLKLSAADKLLRKHGVVDKDGNLTGTGEELLQAKLFEAYKDAIVEDLKLIDKDEKGKK